MNQTHPSGKQRKQAIVRLVPSRSALLKAPDGTEYTQDFNYLNQSHFIVGALLLDVIAKS